MTNLRLAAATLGVGLLVLAGCGGGRNATGEVAGHVVFDGKPYTGATVVFTSPETGASASADIQPDGTFRLETPLPAGSYTVFLTQPAVAVTDPSAPPQPISIDKSVPEKYWSEASDIRAEIQEGENQVTVELKK